jgi:hypothetical protein
MAPTLVRAAFHRDGWVYEEKVDGWRILAYKDGARVRLVSRNGRDHTRRFAGIAAAIAQLSARGPSSAAGGAWRPPASRTRSARGLCILIVRRHRWFSNPLRGELRPAPSLAPSFLEQPRTSVHPDRRRARWGLDPSFSPRITDQSGTKQLLERPVELGRRRAAHVYFPPSV